MKTAVFSAKKYDREFLSVANGSRHELHFFEPHLNEETATLAAGFGAVCVFVNDQVDAAVIASLRSLGVQLIALPLRNMPSQWCAFPRTHLTRWPSTRSPLCWRSTEKCIAPTIECAKVI